MNKLQKILLLAIGFISVIYVVSPVDLMSGIAVDDIFAAIIAIASFAASLIKKKESESYR